MTVHEHQRRKMLRREASDRQGGRCYYCGILMAPAAAKLPWSETADHVFPVARGGITHRSNIVAACRRCNNAKGDNLVDDGSTQCVSPTSLGPQRGTGESGEA
jgi:5-methylcytosine-specific restriction endonuclease McrA